MTGGIDDFKISMGKDESSRVKGQFQPHSSHSHYIILMKQGWEQDAPLRFNNAFLDDLKNQLKLKATIPLPAMPHFFPAGSEAEILFQGRDVLRVESALQNQPLFSHLELLRALVQRCVDRKIVFPEFVAELNKIAIPAIWRNEIVNGLFENADATISAAPKPIAPALSQDIEKLMGLLSDTEPLAEKINPHFGKFLEEVGRDSTGFTLKAGAAKELHDELSKALIALRTNLLRQQSLAETLAFIASLQRLMRIAKSRERQTVHLWSKIPDYPGAILLGENIDEGRDFSQCIVLTDPLERTEEFLKELGQLISKLKCPLLIQLPDTVQSVQVECEKIFAHIPPTAIYFFAGGVAARVDEEACVFRPAALAFLEGLIEAKEKVDFYLHRKMILEDQDLFTEKSQAYSTDKLLDGAKIAEFSEQKMNRVNGARNQSIATFPLLTPWST